MQDLIILSDISNQINNLFSFLFTLDELKTYFDLKFDTVVSELSFIKQILSQFVAIDDNVQNIFSAFSSVNQNLSFLKQSLEESNEDILLLLDNIYFELSHLSTNLLDYSYDTSFYSQQIRITLENLYSDFSSDLDSINSYLSTIINMLSSLLSSILTAVYNSYKSDLSNIADKLDNIYSHFDSFIDRLTDISDKISDLYDKLCDIFDKINDLSSTTTTIVNNINIDNKISFVKDFINVATSLFDSFDYDNIDLQSYTFNFNLFDTDVSFSLDFSFLSDDSVVFIRSLTSALFTFRFIQYLLKRIPNLIFR